ncbi:MAG TPA: hypothetical protein VEP89_17150 [Draconibacterium sp.]|nr:hypothetical protein [Draconibacterium sp.]
MKNELVLNQPGLTELGKDRLRGVDGGFISYEILKTAYIVSKVVVDEFMRGVIDGYKDNNYDKN